MSLTPPPHSSPRHWTEKKNAAGGKSQRPIERKGVVTEGVVTSAVVSDAIKKPKNDK